MEKKEITLYEAVLNKARVILNKNDFAIINKKVEITRDAAIKILSSLPLSYKIEILEQKITEETAIIKVEISIKFNKTGIERTAQAIGTCEKRELRNYSLHNLIARAETRAIKRAIETLLGGVINAVIVEFFGSYEV